jgi:hypothetical protein
VIRYTERTWQKCQEAEAGPSAEGLGLLSAAPEVNHISLNDQRNTNFAMKITHSTHRLAEISLYLPVPAFSAT